MFDIHYSIKCIDKEDYVEKYLCKKMLFSSPGYELPNVTINFMKTPNSFLF